MSIEPAMEKTYMPGVSGYGHAIYPPSSHPAAMAMSVSGAASFHGFQGAPAGVRAAAPVGSPGWGPSAATSARVPRHDSRFARWKQRNTGKAWWKVLLLGLAAYIDAVVFFTVAPTPMSVPFFMLLISAIAPVTFVVYCWERCADDRAPAATVVLTFVIGAMFAVLLAIPLETFFVLPIAVVGPFSIGVIEESVKALAAIVVVWLLRDPRLRGELNGLVLGAAAGMGFDAIENAGYGLSQFLDSYTTSLAHSTSFTSAIGIGTVGMMLTLLLRASTDIFSHGAWTAIVCAALWRDSRGGKLRISWGAALAFAISVTLHATWDIGIFSNDMLDAFLVPCVLGVVGLWILRFFFREGRDRKLLGEAAPAPEPLLRALATYLVHPWRRPVLWPAQANAQPPFASGAPVPMGAANGAVANGV